FRLREDLSYGAGGDMVAGEETDFCRRVMEAGHQSWYLPDACVAHIVRAHQVGVWPVMQRYFRIGRGMYAIGGQGIDAEAATVFGYPRFVAPRLASRIGQAVALLLRRDRQGAVKNLMSVAMEAGRVHQWRVMRRREKCRAAGKSPRVI
ncbi:MAG: hypothetical protein D6782_11685, partial [Alphaproteobacteria bacterium]